MSAGESLERYVDLLGQVKARIAGGQTRAALAANRELLSLYWDIGRMIAGRRTAEGWGAGVIPRLARDLAVEFPDARGYSETNLKRMVQFFEAYPLLIADVTAPEGIGPQPVTGLGVPEIGAQPVPQLAQPAIGAQARPEPLDASVFARLAFDLPWGHNILLLHKVPDPKTRAWYMRRCVDEGWSRDVLGLQIKSQAHTRQAAAITNFDERLPTAQSELARQTLKSPYLFDFLTLDAGFRERELERGLLAHLERFLLELGVGFAFVGRQHHIALDGDDFYLDLLFYHLKLRCFVVIELKVGPFKAEYAGKMNLYLNLVDDTLRHPSDQPSIGLILCQDQKRILAEYALRGMDKPIGVSEYDLTRALPTELESALPSVEQLEAELATEEESQ